MDRTVKIERYYGSLKRMLSKYDRCARQDAFQGDGAWGEENTVWSAAARFRPWLNRLSITTMITGCGLPGLAMWSCARTAGDLGSAGTRPCRATARNAF